MTYSSDRKAHPRDAKRANVLEVPFPARRSGRDVPQACRPRFPSGEPQNEGLGGRSRRSSRSKFRQRRLEGVSYALGEPAFDVKECQQRGLTFASPRCAPRSPGDYGPPEVPRHRIGVKEQRSMGRNPAR